MTTVIATVLVHDSEPGLREVLRLLAAQERQPDAVVVVDNASRVPVVLDHEVGGLTVRCVRSDHNLGVGGGHNLAVRTAVDELHADAVWVLEHDTFPDAGCLAALLQMRAQLERPTAIVPEVTRNNYERNPIALAEDGRPLTRFTFNGPLLDRLIVERVGPFNEEYFVGQEDWEFSARAEASGIPAVRCVAAIVVHANKGDGRFDAFVSPSRVYYSARNLVAANRTTSFAGALVCVGATLVKCARELVSRGRGAKYAAAHWWAFQDGRRGRLGQRQHRFMRG